MAHPCPPTTRHHVEPPGIGSGLRLSSGQIGLLRNLARDSRTGFMVPQFRNKGENSQGRLVLFSGPQGTGKRMAADIVSRELGFSIFQVSLNRVVSRYIGETEKNLARVLKTGELKKAILLFDEAEALLGKRNEVKDSHDRYTNMEVSYLLDRMKHYPGLVILSSNRRIELDSHLRCFLTYHLEFSPPSPIPQRKGR